MQYAINSHPCFGRVPCGTAGRIHLPVAPACNIQCAFCERKYDCANESRPGVTSKVLTPEQAVSRAKEAIRREPRIKVIGIAGPGDALQNEETFQTFRLLRNEESDRLLCLSTNGLLLEDKIDALVETGVNTITVTVNAVDIKTAEQIYTQVNYKGEQFTGMRAGELLLRKQQNGLEKLRGKGIAVKINTVLIPDVNESEIPGIARMAREFEADVMNIMPLIPCGKMKNIPAPSATQLLQARKTASAYLPQFTACRQCRADASGIL